MAEIVERINQVRPTWRLLGFLSPDGKGVGTERSGYPVLGGPEALETYPTACIVPDNEWPRAPALPAERLVSLVDTSAFVSRTATIGVGSVLYPHCFVGLNAHLGTRIFALSGCIINHDDVLEDNVVLASGVTLAGSVHVERDCYLGQSSTVRQQLRIGAGSTLGMGVVVIRDVLPGSVMVGNPARVLRSKS
jgi:sugar O-acyltransferase (sialic acid O-acetyltransferase NeuD family)